MAKPNKYGKGAFKPLNIVPEDEFGVLPEPIDFTRTRYGYEYRGGGVDSSGASSAASFTDSGHGDSPYLGDFGMFMEGRQVAEKSYEENIEDFRNAIEQENIESFKEIVARNNFILEDRIYVDGDKDLSLVEYLFEYEYKGDESCLSNAFDKLRQILFRDVSKYINFDTGYISGLYLDIIDRIISNSNKFLASDLLKNIRQNIPNEVSPRGQAAKDEVLDIVLECSMMNDGDVSCREVFDMFCDSSDFVRLFDFKKKESSFLFDLIINSENCEFNNYAVDSKDCYLSVRVQGQDVLYSYLAVHDCIDCVDCYNVESCELGYELIDAKKCYDVSFSKNIENCSSSKYLLNCKNCKNCFHDFYLLKLFS